MINWEEFEHIHVIKKLKQVLSSWWNIDVVFTDERGHLKGFDTEKMVFNNPAVGYLVNKEVSQVNIAEMGMPPSAVSRCNLYPFQRLVCPLLFRLVPMSHTVGRSSSISSMLI